MDVRSKLSKEILSSTAVIKMSEMPTVLGDKTKIGLVMQHLLRNAIKYQSERPFMIEFGAQQEGNFWVISISDNGIGIAPQYHERIFAIFERLHSEALYPGTGIGLAIAKHIVESHHGEI